MKISNKAKEQIAPGMFGLFFEDINYAADGGLYAELIENRSFEAKEAFGSNGCFYTVEDSGYGWSPLQAEGKPEGKGKVTDFVAKPLQAEAKTEGRGDLTDSAAKLPQMAKEQLPRMQYVQGIPLSPVNPHYLRFTVYTAGQGFANKAYDGIALKKGMNYRVSFYARCVRYQGDGLSISVEKDGAVFAEEHITLKKAAPYGPFCDIVPYEPSGWKEADAIAAYRQTLDLKEYAKESEWVHYETMLTAAEDVRGAAFCIRLDDEGIVEFDLISMIPEDAVLGIFRKDLFDALNDMHPGFIRFPGGCIVEGISLDNRYNWKNTVGAIKDRRCIPNLWGFQDERSITDPDAQRVDAHYSQSYGIGFYEYFLLCEQLGAEPLPVIGVGAACQFRSDEMVDVDAPEFRSFVQDAVDLIEFANGDVTTKWGALRASMGHPESFHLKMLAVGNEQWETEHIHLFRRLDAFEEAIHSAYPDIRLIGTAGPNIDSSSAAYAWKEYRDRCVEKPNYCYAVDEHYYVPPQWMYDRIDLYDSYPRQVGVFAGEYAAHTANRGNNMESALAEAAFLTGIEKNAGVVKLASYAPLFNRIGHSQWKPDMIWFDDAKVYLTPNYYVQKLYASHLGDETVDMEGQEKELREQGIYVSVTRRAEGGIIIKAVNCSGKEFTLPLTDVQGEPMTGAAVLYILQADGEETEGMPQPSKVTECEMSLNGSVVLPAESFTVVELELDLIN